MLRATGSDASVTTGNYIDGVARPAEGGRTYTLYNPARPDELVGHAALSSVGDVDTAVRAAHAAYPAWSRTCLLYTSPSPRDRTRSRMPSSA